MASSGKFALLVDLSRAILDAADAVIEDGASTALKDAITKAEGDFESRIDSACDAVMEFEGRAKARTREAERIRELAKADALVADKIREVLAEVMRERVESGLPKDFGTSKWRLQFRLNAPSVVISDESQVPAQFWYTPTPERKLDRLGVAAALKSGVEVPWAHLQQKCRVDIR